MEEKLVGNIFLIGFMGSGKTTVAKLLNSKWGFAVFDMDKIIEERAKMSIPEIFATYGEAHFRNLETELAIELQGQRSAVISCGGGTAMRKENVAAMKKSGKVVFLAASPETIYERVKDSEDRPLIENNKTIPYIAQLLETRRPAYEEAADLTIHTDGKTAMEICEELISRY